MSDPRNHACALCLAWGAHGFGPLAARRLSEAGQPIGPEPLPKLWACEAHREAVAAMDRARQRVVTARDQGPELCLPKAPKAPSQGALAL